MRQCVERSLKSLVFKWIFGTIPLIFFKPKMIFFSVFSSLRSPPTDRPIDHTNSDVAFATPVRPAHPLAR